MRSETPNARRVLNECANVELPNTKPRAGDPWARRNDTNADPRRKTKERNRLVAEIMREKSKPRDLATKDEFEERGK
jgi:hypothetical protein